MVRTFWMSSLFKNSMAASRGRTEARTPAAVATGALHDMTQCGATSCRDEAPPDQAGSGSSNTRTRIQRPQ